jgi:DNA (cytosine-5)-methyltransferase 1
MTEYIEELSNQEGGSKKPFTFIDLFCGIGGFHEALTQMGGTCVLASDIDEKCKKIYEKNYKIKPEGDIKDIDISSIPGFDVLCSGFPCFVAGTKVLTYDGYKNIEDTNLTDTLMTHTGEFHKILNLQRKIYDGELYTIRAKYHPSIDCTQEHPFYIREKKQKWNNEIRKYEYTFSEPTWKKAYELEKQHYFGMKINENSIIPEFTFNKVINQYKTDKINIKLNDPDMWFMMGYFVGDGWIEETKKTGGSCANKIRFAINTTDEKYVIQRIRNILHITDKKCPSGDNCNKYGCADFVWFQIFKKFGKYAHGKLIPEWVHDAPIQLIEHFIEGYMLADGCETTNQCYEFTTVSYNLAFGLQRLYLKLGHLFSIQKDIRAKTTIIEGRMVNQRDTYHIRGYTKENKKNTSSFIEDGYVWYAPFKIEKRYVEKENVYNFEVEKDNSYIIENIICHNCQPFSKAGYQKGFDDDRGNLFFNICDIVKHHKPKYLLLENVRNLSTHDDGNTWNVIHKHILDMGYSTYDIPVILNVLHFNIPQNRERVIIMCKRKDLGPLQELPEIPKNPKLYLTRTLKDFIFDKEKDEHAKYKITGKLKDVEQVWDKFIKLLISKSISIPKFPIWTDWWDKNTSDDPAFYRKYKNWIDKNQAFYVEHKSVVGPWLKKSRKIENWTGAVRKFEWQAGEERSDDGMHSLLWTARGSGIRAKRPDYIPTLVAMSMIPVYGPQSRKLTPKELLRMQSFPDTFEFVEKDIYKQLGNAVNVDMIKKCADYLMNEQELFD